MHHLCFILDSAAGVTTVSIILVAIVPIVQTLVNLAQK